MALFGFGSRKSRAPAAPPAPDPRLVNVIYERACAYVMGPDKRIHVEDLLSALAAVTGEACLRAVGEVPIESHAFTPGSMVFSEAVNRVLCDDARSWPEAPADSVFGVLYREAVAASYDPAAFPPLPEVFALLAKGVGATEWGWVPLSTKDGRPFVMPIRAAFELRAKVTEALNVFAIPPGDQARVCAYALAKALAAVREAIDHEVALSISVETVNGMAKTAPMTAAHFAEMQKGAAS